MLNIQGFLKSETTEFGNGKISRLRFPDTRNTRFYNAVAALDGPDLG